MNKKILKLFVEFFLIIAIVIGFALINESISEKRKCEFKLIENTNSYAYQIESIGIDGDDYVIAGWFFELKRVRNIASEIDDKKNIGIVLYDIQSEKSDNSENRNNETGIALNVEKIIRTDVDEYYKCEYDYSNCGFIARINKTELDLKNGKYQVIIKPESDSVYGIPTETYINNGMLQYTNPSNEIEIDGNDTTIDDIVSKAYCLANSLEYKFSIYQYDNKLYWIVTDDSLFNKGKIFMNFQIDTTQFEKLPSKRIDDGLFWGIISGEFESHEINIESNDVGYRISVWDIPEDYSVVQVLAGFYIDEQRVWQKTIRPVFLYKND